MPIYNTMLNIMPYHCRYCKGGFYAMQHISEEAEKQGLVLIELQKEQAEKDPVWETLTTEDPVFVNGFGHGNDSVYTGDSETPIFWVGDCGILAGRVCYFLSCLTANSLGPAVIDAGGIAYGGYNIEWTWMAVDVDVDPYTDWYAEAFFRSSNEFPIALIQGETVAGARDRCVAEYNRWIEIWETERADDAYAASVIKWLICDRDGLTVLGHLDATIRTPPPEEVTFTVDSEPISITFLLDGVEHSTPWTGRVSGGLHRVIVEKAVPIEDDRYYLFRHWENGSTRLDRGVWLAEDTAIKATYEEVVAHTLSVDSDPVPVEFTINKVSQTTPYSELLEDGLYEIEMPLRFQKEGVWYGFDHWEDGSTELKRTINLTSDTSLKVYYRVLATYTLTVAAFIDDTEWHIHAKLDGKPIGTPYTVVVPEGPHTVEVDKGLCMMGIKGRNIGGEFLYWEDGSTENVRNIDLTGDLQVSAYYRMISGCLVVRAKNAPTQEKLKVPFKRDGSGHTTGSIFPCIAFDKPHTLKIVPEYDNLAFNYWSDGTTSTTNTFTFHQERIDFVAYFYPVAPRHTFSIDTQPEGIKFKLNEAKPTTPFTGDLIEGDYVVEMPRVANVNGVYYMFKKWGDGYTKPRRSLTLTEPTSLLAIYTEIPTPQISTYVIERRMDNGMSGIPGRTPIDTDYLQLNFRCWVRWALKDIPPGARVLSACFTGFADYYRDDPTRLGPVQFQHTDEDDAVEFTSDPHSRPVSGPIVEWKLPNPWEGPGAWIDALEYSIDITEIVRDFVERPGYRQGNHIAIRIDPAGNPVNGQQFTTYDGNPEKAPRLEVIWLPPAGTHTLKIESSPITEVPVRIDGVDVGNTPVTKTVDEGEHVIEVPKEIET